MTAKPLSEVVDGWPEVELRIERVHVRIAECKRVAQSIRDASHEPGREPEELERAARWDNKAAELESRLRDESDALDDFASPELAEAFGLSGESVGRPQSNTETPEQRRERLAKRKLELLAQSHRAPTKQIAEEEGISEVRVRQILQSREQSKSPQTASDPFGLAHKRS
jgi:hypothetical protein